MRKRKEKEGKKERGDFGKRKGERRKERGECEEDKKREEKRNWRV